MDIQDLKRAVQAGRRWQVEVSTGRTVTLQRPSRFDMQMASAQAGLSAGGAGPRLMWERLVLRGAVADWQGVTASDLGVAGSADPVAFDAGVAEMLLDAQPEWADRLAESLWAEVARHAGAQGEAEKN